MTALNLTEIISVLLLALACLYPWVVTRDSSFTQRVATTLFSASQLVCVAAAFMTVHALHLAEENIILFAFVALLCAISDVPLFRALRNFAQAEKEADQAALLKDQLSIQEIHLEHIRQEQKEAANLRQHFCSQLIQLESALHTGDEATIEACLDKAALAVSAPKHHYCKHLAMDALLVLKAEQCADNEISFTCDAQVPESMSIPDVELCAIVGNALDNAINACLQLAPNQRWVRVRIAPAHGYLSISVSNAFAGEQLSESKSDSESSFAPNPALEEARPGSKLVSDHGWGHKIMEAIAKRYDGELTCRTEDNEYHLHVIVAAKQIAA